MQHEATRAIHHWYTANPKIAFDVLDRLVLERSSSNESRVSGGLADDDVDSGEDDMQMLVNMVVASWQKLDETTMDPTEVLKKIEGYIKHCAQPICDIHTYTMILNAATHRGKSSSAARLADQILKKVEQDDYLFADGIFYSNAIMAYAKSGRQDAVKQAQTLLKKIQASNQISNEAYIGVITAWANSNHPKAPERAEALLEEMNQHPDLEANTKAFGAVLNVWAKSSNPKALPRVLIILQSMRDHDIEANSVVYATVMDAFAKRGKAVEAEKILQELIDKYEDTQNEEFAPNVVLFTIVIDAWSKSRHPKAPMMAEAILERMQRLSEANPELQPNAVSFNGVMHAWSNSRNPQAPERAEKILHTLQNLYEESSNPALKPSRISVATVIDCWAKSRDPRAASRAEAILNHMCKLHEDGDEEMKPDIVCFTAVMDAYAKSRPPRSAQTPKVDVIKKVEGLYQQMHDSFGIQPSVYTYAVLIHAWVKHAKSPFEAVQRTEEIFREVHSRYEGGNIDCKPNVILYNSLINAYSKAGAGQKAQEMLDEMEQLGDIEPTIVSYNSVISAWSNSADRDVLNHVESLIDRVQKHPEIQPDGFTFGTAMVAFSRSQDPKATERTMEYFAEAKRQYGAGNRRCKPSVIIYGTAINALSRRRYKQEEAADQILSILREAKSENLVLLSQNYRSVLECISHTKDRALAAYAVLQEMDKYRIEAITAWHLTPILQACAWTEGSEELKKDALEIAKLVYQRVRDPSEKTFEHMIWVASGASDTKLVEQIYRDCEQHGFHSSRKIQQMVKRVAPQLLVDETR